MGLQGWLIRDGLARKLWEGTRQFMFCFLFTGQGRTIALGLRDEMNRANTLPFARTWGSGLVSTSWSLLGASATVELFYWCLKKYNQWSFYQISWIGESVWVFFLKVKLVKYCFYVKTTKYNLKRLPIAYLPRLPGCLFSELRRLRIRKNLRYHLICYFIEKETESMTIFKRMMVGSNYLP